MLHLFICSTRTFREIFRLLRRNLGKKQRYVLCGKVAMLLVTVWIIRRASGAKESPQLPGKNILLLSTRRSGSSFVGQLFARHPNIVYLFEPLKLTNPSGEASNHTLFVPMLKNTFNCDFKALEEYTRQHTNSSSKDIVYWQNRVYESLYSLLVGRKRLSTYHRPTAPSPTSLEGRCRTFHHRAVKEIRGRGMRDAWDLLPHHVTVLYLVRDPRGVISSRIKIELFRSKEKDIVKYIRENKTAIMNDVRSICHKYEDSIDFLTDKYITHRDDVTQKVRLLRYEDVAFQPVRMAVKTYEFLDVVLKKPVVTWIKGNTQNDSSATRKKYYFDTKRNSRLAAENWRRHLPFSLVRDIEDICMKVMTSLGYKLSNTIDYADMTFSYVLPVKLPYALT